MASPQFEGEKQSCHCKTDLTARIKPASEDGKYPARLQWQNPDGTAHYRKNMSTGKFECNIPGGIPAEQFTSNRLTDSQFSGTPVSNSNETVRAAEKFYRGFLESAGEIRKAINPNADLETSAQLDVLITAKLVDIALSGKVK